MIICPYHWSSVTNSDQIICPNNDHLSLLLFLPLRPSLRLDRKIQFWDNQAMVRAAVGATHGFGHSYVPPVLGPGDDIVNEMPVPWTRMHPCCLVAGWQAEHGVGNGQVVWGAQNEQEETIAVVFSSFSGFNRRKGIPASGGILARARWGRLCLGHLF